MRSLPLRSLLALTLLSFASLAIVPGSGEDETQSVEICHSCWWTHQSKELKDELHINYGNFRCGGDFCSAEAEYLLSNLLPDPARLPKAFAGFERALANESDPFNRLVLEETLAMLAPKVGAERGPHLAAAARHARSLGMEWRAALDDQLATQRVEPRFGDAPIRRKLTVPSGATHVVLGESAIHVRRGARIGVQLERTYRDWLSFRFDYDFRPGSAGLDNIVRWHEGARLAELIEYAQAVPVPLTGALLAWRDGRWYAPDENGVFRFYVLHDKLQYPSVRQSGRLALMMDTHGVGPLVEPALRQRLDMVIACGDNPGKARASYHLAKRGVDVYTPCDREIGMLLGHDGANAVLGTAPIRRTADGAVIGAQPVTISLSEPIVVEDVERDSAARYHDAGMRYFRQLAAHVPLEIYPSRIDGLGQMSRTVALARSVGATVIAGRVADEEGSCALTEWLEESPSHRAVLFHSAPYPAGYRLFFQFPAQVTFGDPRPRFVTGGQRAASEAAGGSGTREMRPRRISTPAEMVRSL